MKQQVPSHCDLPGFIIMYYDKGVLLPAIILSQQDNTLQILDLNCAEKQLNTARITIISHQRYSPDLDSLHAFWAEVNASKPALPEIPDSGLSLSELDARQDLQSDAERFALLLRLKSLPERYYQKHELFFMRSDSEQDRYIAMQKQYKQRKEYLIQVQDFIQDSQLELPAQIKWQIISELRQILQGEKIDDLYKVLLRFSADPLKLAIRMRSELGDTGEISDPALLASGLPICFKPQPEALDLSTQELPLAPHSAFTIDDEDSLDFDDALSLEELTNGYRLGIHVSNLAHFLSPEQDLFLVAQRRVSSLYLPSGIVPMLPPRYSEQGFSLIQGQERAVLSLYADFDSDLKLLTTKLVAQKIRISKNMTYNEVDRDFGSILFSRLNLIAAELKTKRDPEVVAIQHRYIYNLKVILTDIKVKPIDLMSPARMMIEEMMIFYNRSLALYAAKHKMPMMFRNIKRFASRDSASLNSSAYLDTQAGYHPGIGAEAYIHATSPIRRVVDLINQKQIQNHLQKGDICFSEDRLQALIPHIEKRLLLIRATLQKSERYWLLKLIEKKHLNSPLEGIVKGRVNGNLRAEILPWGKQLLLRMDANPEAEYFNFVAYEIDWSKMLLKADLIG